MNRAYAYWAKQIAVPLCKVAALLAEYKVAMEDVRLENYDDQYTIFHDGYLRLFLKNRHVYEANGAEQEGEPCKIMVDLEAFVMWAFDKQIPMPNELLAVIDKDDKSIKMKTPAVDREIFRAIARTIWYFTPDSTQVEIAEHEAVKSQFGTLYAHKTYMNWISGVGKKKRSRPTQP